MDVVHSSSSITTDSLSNPSTNDPTDQMNLSQKPSSSGEDTNENIDYLEKTVISTTTSISPESGDEGMDTKTLSMDVVHLSSSDTTDSLSNPSTNDLTDQMNLSPILTSSSDDSTQTYEYIEKTIKSTTISTSSESGNDGIDTKTLSMDVVHLSSSDTIDSLSNPSNNFPTDQMNLGPITTSSGDDATQTYEYYEETVKSTTISTSSESGD
jgi:hypothetical protein